MTNIYRNSSSPFGYDVGEEDRIDAYGVDHSNFSLRDEIEYQMARVNREDQFKQNYNNQGITDNYPQFGKSFWGNSSENNYGFGSSNISENIEQMKSKGFPTLEETLQYQNQMNGQNSMTTPTPLGQSSLGQNSANNSYKLSLSTGFGQNGLSDNLKNMLQNQSLNNSVSSQYGDAFKARPNYDDISTGITYDFPVDLHKSALNQDNEQNTIDYSLYGNGFSKTQIDEMNNYVKFQEALKRFAVPNEGGYINHPNDRGGETKYGISRRWYPNEDISNLTRERANIILFRDYWKNRNINQLPDELAYRVFDNAIVQGQPTAVRNLQRALGVKADGQIGPNTLNAVNSQDYNTIRKRFIDNVNKVEDEYQRRDPRQKVFEKGHRNRYKKY